MAESVFFFLFYRGDQGNFCFPHWPTCIDPCCCNQPSCCSLRLKPKRLCQQNKLRRESIVSAYFTRCILVFRLKSQLKGRILSWFVSIPPYINTSICFTDEMCTRHTPSCQTVPWQPHQSLICIVHSCTRAHGSSVATPTTREQRKKKQQLWLSVVSHEPGGPPVT